MADCSALLTNGTMENILTGAFCPYTNIVGDMFFVFIFGTILYSLMMKNGSAIGVTVISLVSMSALPFVLPEEVMPIAYILIVILVSGVLYSVSKSRGV